MNSLRETGVVLALGSGGARGMAHVGVLEVLAEVGIPIRAIVGSSIGVEIGALYAAGMNLPEMRHLVQDVDWKATLRFFLPELGKGGVVTDKRIRAFLEPYLANKNIQDLPISFAAIATDLYLGEQVVFDHGNMLDAVRASISIPGLLPPSKLQGKILADGALVNPVPFDVARNLFGGPVIAVAVHTGATPAFYPIVPTDDWKGRLEAELKQSLLQHVPQLDPWIKLWDQKNHAEPSSEWGIGEIYSRAMDVSRAELMRLREQISPPDFYIKPKVEHISMLEFYRGEEALKAGRVATEALVEKMHSLHQI